QKPMRLRIAPSPTGIAHIGTAWLAMFNLALARQSKGKFLIRIEDTDRARFVPEAEKLIYEGLGWLGIDYDEGGAKGGPHAPYRQSERLEIYRKYVEQLVAKGHAYYCFCTKEDLEKMRAEQLAAGELPKYNRKWRDADKTVVRQKLAAGEPYVIRLKVPDGREIKWQDLIRGEVVFQSSLLDDQVLLKADGYPTYHLGVVVDDHLMEITHILRGEEWISSTPKHILLYEAFGWKMPEFAHMPLIRNADKSKMSKRKNDVSILSYRDKGYLPEAVRNFIALLGWSHPEEKEVFSFREFLKVVSLERVQKTGPVFDVEKLNWYNGFYIRTIVKKRGLDALHERLKPFYPQDYAWEQALTILALVYERLVTLTDIEELTSFFYREIEVETDLLLKKSDVASVAEQLTRTIDELGKIEENDWTTAKIEEIVRGVCETQGYKKSQYFMMVRVAVTGKKATPPLFETMEVLGKEKVVKRLEGALTKLENYG
ncbi:glutamate--tRNA ligase, partial [Microgenomates group bacterium]|nr:glutamate--tRNA ligase [Microgenomates group bacterium]